MILVQLTDLHVRPRGLPANRVAETNMLTERAFRAVASRREQLDAIVISGDLVDGGEAAAYECLAGMLRRAFQGRLVYVIPGNHDDRAKLRATLRDLPGVNDDPEFVQYVVDDLPMRLVMLDTLVPGEPYGWLCERRLDWLDRMLAAAPERPTIVVMHHPPFACGLGHMDEINLRNAAEFAAVIARHGQVERILCGHHHRPIVARVAHAIASIAPSVAHQVELDLMPGVNEGFLVFEPAAYQMHLWTPAGGVVSHTAYVESYPGPFPFTGADALG